MSKHNLSEKSNFTNLSEFLVPKKIIYFVALKYDHTVEVFFPLILTFPLVPTRRGRAFGFIQRVYSF